MSKYIDVDAVIEQIRKKLGIKSLDYLLEAERQIVDVIQSAPSIDIVRCRECRYREVYPCKEYDDDWFCADGEREVE